MGNASKKLTLLKRKGHPVKILDQEFVFYPISVRMLFELRTVLEPIMAALSALFKGGGTENDVQKIVQKGVNPETNQPEEVVQVSPASLDIIRLRHEQRGEQVKRACDVVFNPENRMQLGRILADSLREEFPAGHTDDDIKEFICHENMDLEALILMVQGFLAANGKVFGPFVAKLQQVVKAKLEEALSRAELAKKPVAGESSEPQTGEAAPTTP